MKGMLRFVLAFLSVASISVTNGQVLERTLYFPDSMTGINSIMAMEYAAAGHRNYIGGSSADCLLAIDVESREKVRRIPFGYASDLCWVADVGRLFVAGDRLAVYDPVADTLVAEIPGAYATALAYCPVGRKLYAVGSPVRVVDVETNVVIDSFYTGSPFPDLACYNETANKLYLTTDMDSVVYVVDCDDDSLVARVALPLANPFGCGFLCANPSSNKVYCGFEYTPSLAVIDGTGDSLSAVLPSGNTGGLYYCAATGMLYQSAIDLSRVRVYDGAADTLVAEIPTPRYPSRLCQFAGSSDIWCFTLDSLVRIDGRSHVITGRTRVQHLVRVVEPAGGSGDLYCAGELNSLIEVIDTNRPAVVESLVTGSGPVDLVYNKLHDKLYVINRSDQTAAVVDGSTNEVRRVLPLRAEPRAACYGPLDDRVYICGSDSDRVVVIDCRADSVIARAPAGDLPREICYDPARNYVLVLGRQSITVLDGTNLQHVGTLPLSYTGRSSHLSCSPTSGRAYSAKGGGVDSVEVFDLVRMNRVCALPIPENPTGAAWDSTRNRLYVSSTFQRGYVTVVDCAGDSVVTSVEVCEKAADLCFSPELDRLFVADPDSGNLVVIDPEDMAVAARVPLGCRPSRVCVDAERAKAYCVSNFDSTLAVVDVRNNRLLTSFHVGSGTGFEFAHNPRRGRTYLANRIRSSLSVFRDGASGLAGGIPGRGEEAGRRHQTIVRGALPLDGRQPASLLDVSGRRVMQLLPGRNDVSHLTPGVYFCRDRAQDPGPVRRLLVIR